MAGAEEQVAHARLRRCAHALRAVRIREQLADPARRSPAGRAARRASPCSPSSIWSWMPPTAVATTGRPFHIASATVSPKPSAMLFCTTTSGAALQRVDDHGVLVRVLHRQHRQVHPPPRRAGQRMPCRLDLGEHPGTLGVVGDRGDVRAREHEVRRLVCAHVLHEAGQHAERILEVVPARHLRDQRRVEQQRAPPRSSARCRWTRPALPSSRSNTARDGWWWSAARPAARSIAGHRR